MSVGHPAALLALLLASEGIVPPPDPSSLAGEILALASSGDPARLARARQMVPDPLRADPAYRSAAAARAIAGLVGAADLRERSAVSTDGAEGLRRARSGQEAALEELRSLAREAPGDPDVLRAIAVYYGLDGRPSETAQATELARRSGVPAGDPWLPFALLAAGLRGRPAAEAEPLLVSWLPAHAGILPPWMSLARARLALGDRDGAVAALDGLLAADPEHDAARELKSTLLAPPPVEPVAPSVPSSAPRPTAPGHLPRKRPAHAG